MKQRGLEGEGVVGVTTKEFASGGELLDGVSKGNAMVTSSCLGLVAL